MSVSEKESNTYRNEEDRIIESLILEGLRRLYDDSDFLPIRQSLYNIENVVPIYDDEISASIVWCRPQVIHDDPVYFNSYNHIAVTQGNLPDEVFISALIGVCIFPKYDLMENIFSSRPEDFKRHGVFTCRFYVEGDWVEVITDTNIPCLRDGITNLYTPVYSRSSNRDEMWISLAEKAYAKAVGSYEAIPRVKIQEALMHLTGGSIQPYRIQEDTELSDTSNLWSKLKASLDDYTIILAMPASTPVSNEEDKEGKDDSSTAESSTVLSVSDDLTQPDQFLQKYFYSIVAYSEFDTHKLLLIHNSWSKQSQCWLGKWSNGSRDWDMNQDLLKHVLNGLSVPWTPTNSNGYFWIACEDFHKYFDQTYFCKLFPTSKYKFYCIKDEWREKQAGGPINTVREKELAAKAAMESRKSAAHKVTATTVVDGDISWFNNPQVRIHTSKATKLFISCLPLSADKDGGGLAVGIDIVATKRPVDGIGIDHLHIWDAVTCDILASDKVDSAGRVKGQESSIWALSIDPNHNYHIIPHTMKRGQEGYFLLRIFATESIVVEQIPSLYFSSLHSDWHRSHDTDTTGGPLKLMIDGHLKENPKWSQNPQFHLELQDLFSKEEVKLKIVVRRTDKGAHLAHHRSGQAAGTTQAAAEASFRNTEKGHEQMVGVLVCRAICLEENVLKNKLKKQPRLSAVGEIIPSRTSSLQQKKPAREPTEDDLIMIRKDTFDITKIPRKYSVQDDPHFFESTYSSRSEAVIHFVKISRSLIPQGLLIIPSLNEKGIKGSFELEVYSSEVVTLKQLPDAYNKSIASEWTEQTAMGSHIHPNWKKNPKFTFSFRHSSKSMANAPIPVRITLGRYGLKWKSMSHKDTVGCMIGFYIFIHRNNDLISHYESPFVPTEELSTGGSFTLAPLPSGEEYIIMPTTYSEGKIGSFILSIMTENEFRFSKEK